MADHEGVLREHGYHPLTVKQVIDETPDARSYVLDVPGELGRVFAYKAGQFCTFRVHHGDGELMRCYSMSSAPACDDELTVTVKRVPEGIVSNWFNDEVTAGDVLEVAKPAGVFCLHDGEAPVVAFCGGSGVTPVFSIVKFALATTSRPVRVFYANRDADSVIFAAALVDLQAAHPERLEVVHHLDSERGIVAADELVEFLDGQVDADYFICGPTPFMDLAERVLLGAGVDPSRVAIERFLAGGPLPLDDVAEPPPADDAGDVTETLTIILKGKKTTMQYKQGDTVLDSARRAGLQAPFSCELGNCATCMAFVREGGATMRVNNALTPQEVEEGWVLTCQSTPVGTSVVVEYESI
jgi:3-ketosteroid 9alpha-monooxygenase subunit B